MQIEISHLLYCASYVGLIVSHQYGSNHFSRKHTASVKEHVGRRADDGVVP